MDHFNFCCSVTTEQTASADKNYMTDANLQSGVSEA